MKPVFLRYCEPYKIGKYNYRVIRRNLLTGEEEATGYWKNKEYADMEVGAYRDLRDVGPTCDGIARWAYNVEFKEWARGAGHSRCFVWKSYTSVGLYDWQVGDFPAAGEHGDAPTLHQAKRAAERAAGV